MKDMECCEICYRIEYFRFKEFRLIFVLKEFGYVKDVGFGDWYIFCYCVVCVFC